VHFNPYSHLWWLRTNKDLKLRINIVESDKGAVVNAQISFSPSVCQFACTFSCVLGSCVLRIPAFSFPATFVAPNSWHVACHRSYAKVVGWWCGTLFCSAAEAAHSQQNSTGVCDLVCQFVASVFCALSTRSPAAASNSAVCNAVRELAHENDAARPVITKHAVR